MSFSLSTLATRSAASLAEARTLRAEQRRVRAELDSYRTPAERAELDAILARHSSEELELLARATGRSYAA